MAQDIVNNNQGISYTNLDFSSIYTEVLDLVKKLTYKWDPSISDESDPGVILVKLSALIADKCNYNIDKSILEAFPLSVTQQANARQLYEQLGYYMHWYEAATVPVVLNWIKQGNDVNQDVKEYTIPLFTPICTEDGGIKYVLIGVEGKDGVVVSNGVITTDSRELKMVAMEGIAAQYSYQQSGGNEKVVTAQMVDKDTHRIYFLSNSASEQIAQNGIFITNTGQSNYSSWKRVDNLYEQSYSDLRYKFGYDQSSQSCYLEFPDNYAELIGDGIEIVYIMVGLEEENTAQDIPPQQLTRFVEGVVPAEDSSITLNSANVRISNYAEASGHKEPESINDAYFNYKKVVGTFKTLITLRDYLNYIKSRDLDICSNAFVCDRTNDVQSVYKVVSKQHGLDSILVNVEQIVDKTNLQSNFDYTFSVSNDSISVPGKDYYIIENDMLIPISDTTGGTPKDSGWYEFTSRVIKKRDALNAFSLKFYMLKNSILLTTAEAFNETFDMTSDKLDMQSILSDTAHLEHEFEDILPLGENSYKKTKDTHYLEHKAYYIQSNEINKFKLHTNYTVGDPINVLTNTVYELDVEALLPHIVFYKNIYPLTVNVSTYDNLNEKTQEEVQKNILKALYEGLNSSELDFGEAISTIYLEEIVKASDTHIRSASFDPFNYTTKAVYYDGNNFKSVTLPYSIENMGIDQKDEESVLADFVSKDIIVKSILSGVTSLLVPDDIFTYHLNHKFINYFNDVHSITSQATIDIGGEEALTTYSSDRSTPKVVRSYTLKQNEALHLYRPQLENVKEFSSGIHFEYFIYNDIKAHQSYELQNGEYFIFYQSIYNGENVYEQPDGFSVQACTHGGIINPSFDILAQTDIATLSNFSTANVIPYFEANVTENVYETNTYTPHFVTEIFNNGFIRTNAIAGTNTINLQRIYEVTLTENDNYKFFWSLKTPKYSNDNTIKSYTLFPEYDMRKNRLSDKERNSYTLKTGERLYYTDSSHSSLVILGEGTTIYRNCGINSDYDDDNAHSCFEYVNINQFKSSGTDIRFKDGSYETITNQDNTLNPKMNGFYELNNGVYERTLDELPEPGTDYYILVMNDNSGLYKRIGDSDPYQHSPTLQTSDVFSLIDLNSYMSNLNPKDEGLYEIVSTMTHGIQDYYALSSGASYDNYFRYAKTLDDTTITRKIFTGEDYADIDISDRNTYRTISITDENIAEFDYISNRLLVPTDGDSSYKPYYVYNEGTERYARVTGITLLDNPTDPDNNHIGLPWYELVDNEYVLTEDLKPEISSEQGSLSSPETITADYCFEEVPYLNWPSGDSLDYKKLGYFYKYDSSTVDYIFPQDSEDSNVFGKNTNIPILESFMRIFGEAEKTHGETSYSNIINYIINNWDTNISYIHPFKTSKKLGWKVKKFKAAPQEIIDLYSHLFHYETSEGSDSSSETSEGSEEHYNIPTMYFGFSSSYFKEHEIESILPADIDIYPRCSLNIDYTSGTAIDKVDIIVPSFELPDTTIEPIMLVEDGYVEILDRRGDISDKILCDYLNNINESFVGLTSFCMKYPPNIYKFKDLIRRLNKSYYKPNLYVEKVFGAVDSWSCEALDINNIARDPISVISDKWQDIQPNTSITIDQNEIWSFAEGDTVRFMTDVATQQSIVWPRFGNTEIPLDLDKYSISYQRKGASIEELDNLILNGHQWQGYSQLILNTSSKEGQKLESNHSVILYDDSNREITIINGSDYENVSIQLKTPISNVAGRYIDVTTSDIYGNTSNNGIYEFVPLISTNSNYVYTSDHKTYSIFDTEKDSDTGFNRIINSQVRIPILLPEGRYLLPVYTDSPGVSYWVNKYISTRTPDSDNIEYCINMDPEFASSSNTEMRISANTEGEHLYGYNKDRALGFKINNTDYSYLDIINEIFTEKSETYENVSQTYMPDFNGREYYELIDGSYVLVESMPDDWETNWWEYYIKNINIKYYRKVKLPAYLTSTYFEDGSGTIQKSPQDLHWYELDNDGHFSLSENTGVGSDLLDEIELKLDSYDWLKYTNPNKEGWYERVGVEGSYYYILTSDTHLDMRKLVYYEHLADQTIPEFISNKYYAYNEGLDSYIPIEDKPENWDTNWTDYYVQAYREKVYFKDKDFYIPTDVLSDPCLKINAENNQVSMNSDKVYIIFEDVFKYINNPIFKNYIFNEINDKVKQLDVDDKFNYAFIPDKNSYIEDPLVPISFFKSNHPFNNYTIPQLDIDNLYFRFPAIRGRR